jgi:hypothetical protein
MSFTSFSPTLIEYTAPKNISCRSIEGSRFEFLNSRNWLICRTWRIQSRSACSPPSVYCETCCW